MPLNKKLAIVFSVVITIFLANCSDESIDNKTHSPQQNKIDSLAMVKDNKALEAAELRNELDSLQKYLDSLKAISVDSTK